MDGKRGLDAERFKAPPILQVLAADARCGCRVVREHQLSGQPIDCSAFLRALGRAMPARIWSEDRFEALRIEDADGNVAAYTMYDRACEYFRVPALKLGQLETFKAAAALGFIQ